MEFDLEWTKSNGSTFDNFTETSRVSLRLQPDLLPALSGTVGTVNHVYTSVHRPQCTVGSVSGSREVSNKHVREDLFRRNGLNQEDTGEPRTLRTTPRTLG